MPVVTIGCRLASNAGRRVFYLKVVIATLATMALWVIFLGITSLYGWWHKPLAAAGDLPAFAEQAIALIGEKSRGNAALILIEAGEVVVEHFDSKNMEVDRETLFPTASMSKWITAVGVMRLVEEGKVDLDTPVNDYLSRWKLSDAEFPADQVTVGRLLSHTSGLTDGLGFGDYEPDEVVPSIDDSLINPRASSGVAVTIAAGQIPGEFEYSGGGYLILELLVEEVSGQDFATYIQQEIFQPLGMSRSTYQYLGAMDNVSDSYDEFGERATLYRYAAKGATSFSTTSGDLVRFVQAQLPGFVGQAPLSEVTRQAMREPQASLFGIDIWGLGTILYAPTSGGDFVFGHDGGNEPAINSAARINPETGDAFIMLVSGHKNLASTLGFHWVFWQTGLPDFRSIGVMLEGVVSAMIVGCLLILALGIFFVWRRKAHASATSPT
jgi:CubicO group peptidase (beta-lactamase class C family)